MLTLNLFIMLFTQLLVILVANANEKYSLTEVNRPQLSQFSQLENSALSLIDQSQVPQQARVLIHNHYAQLKTTPTTKTVVNHSLAEVNFRSFQGTTKIEVGAQESSQIHGKVYQLSSLHHYPSEINLISHLIYEEFKKNSGLREVILASLENQKGEVLTAEKLAIEFISRRDRLSQAEKDAMMKYFMHDFRRQESNLKMLIQMTKDLERKKILIGKFFQVSRLEAPNQAAKTSRLSLVRLGRGQLSSLLVGTASVIIAKQAFVGQAQAHSVRKQKYQAQPQSMAQSSAK